MHGCFHFEGCADDKSKDFIIINLFSLRHRRRNIKYYTYILFNIAPDPIKKNRGALQKQLADAVRKKWNLIGEIVVPYA